MYFPVRKYMTGPRAASLPGQRPARAGRDTAVESIRCYLRRGLGATPKVCPICADERQYVPARRTESR
jgi:hypothetical protein